MKFIVKKSKEPVERMLGLIIGTPGITATALAKRMGMQKASVMTAMDKQLVRRKLVTARWLRRTNGKIQMRICYYPTEQGKNYWEEKYEGIT